MKDIFERLFSLIGKTGDKVVFYDSVKDEAYVIMKMKDYEVMVNGKSGQPNLTDFRATDKIEKINQEIALWREEAQKSVEATETEASGEIPKEDKNEEESQFYFEPVE